MFFLFIRNQSIQKWSLIYGYVIIIVCYVDDVCLTTVLSKVFSVEFSKTKDIYLYLKIMFIYLLLKFSSKEEKKSKGSIFIQKVGQPAPPEPLSISPE